MYEVFLILMKGIERGGFEWPMGSSKQEIKPAEI